MIYRLIVCLMAVLISPELCGSPYSYQVPTLYQQAELAIDRYDLELLQKIVLNIDLNQQDECGQTLLHKAIPDGRVEILQILIEHGANVNCTDYQGATPLYYVLNSMIEGLAMCYADVDSWNEDAFKAYFDQYIDMAAYLVKSGANLSQNYDAVMIEADWDRLLLPLNNLITISEYIDALIILLKKDSAFQTDDMQIQAYKHALEYLIKFKQVLR